MLSTLPLGSICRISFAGSLLLEDWPALKTKGGSVADLGGTWLTWLRASIVDVRRQQAWASFRTGMGPIYTQEIIGSGIDSAADGQMFRVDVACWLEP